MIVLNVTYCYHGANCIYVRVEDTERHNYYKLYNDYNEFMKEVYGYDGLFDYLIRLEAGEEA